MSQLKQIFHLRVRSIGKSGFRFSKSKSGFPNRTYPKYIRTSRYRHLSIVDRFFFFIQLCSTDIAYQDLPRGECKGFQKPLFS